MVKCRFSSEGELFIEIKSFNPNKIFKNSHLKKYNLILALHQEIQELKALEEKMEALAEKMVEDRKMTVDMAEEVSEICELFILRSFKYQ